MKIGYLKLRNTDTIFKVWFEKDLNLAPDTKFFEFLKIEKDGTEKTLMVNLETIIYLEYWEEREIKQ